MSAESRPDRGAASEAGQSIVLIAFIIVGILAFVGLAADAGFLFARRAQFSAAVDAAVLAAVRDLQPADPSLTAPNARAGQFLAANRWPTATLASFASNSSIGVQGIPQYTLTATWPVETFFLRLVGIDEVNVTHSATAVYSVQAEVLTPTNFQAGKMSTASQYIFGPDSCSEDGDPVNAKYGADTSTPNDNFAVVEDGYQYDIRVPSSYGEDFVRVELFDPDSANFNVNPDADVTHSDAYASRTGTASTADVPCAGTSGAGQICAMPTGEQFGGVAENPLWLLRVDENYNADCSANAGDPNGNTVSEYRLYYVDANGQRQTLATYTATNVASTDMQWVAPGTPYTADVPVDEGSSFDVEVASIPLVDGVRHIYLSVITTGGYSKNVWDVRAGPPYDSLARNVNQRNLQLANNPGTFVNEGVSVVAQGRMPLQHYRDSGSVTLALAPIDTAQGGGTIYATTFDFEAQDPLNFTISSLASGEFDIDGTIVGSNPDTAVWQTTCDGGTNCDNSWMIPQFAMGIPGDPADPTSSSFFGGNLEVEYTLTSQDAHVWSVSIQAGEPFLTE